MTEMSNMTILQEEARQRWDYAHEAASCIVTELDVDPKGIVFRCTVSRIYKDEFPTAIEENDYFLKREQSEDSQLPERIKSLYKIDEGGL